MKIEYLVRRSFNTTDPLAGINSIERCLRENSYLVVMDKGAFLGILTPSDIIESPHQLVIDCLHDKPRVNCEKDIASVLNIMKKSRNYVLPVFEKDNFIGVVTRAAITDYLFEYCRELKREISDIKQANERIKVSLKEKEVLFRDIHHRVKNNLQIISSLLDLRIIRQDNPHVIHVFEDTISKIQTIALIHSQLYESERFNRINMRNYVQKLVNYLSIIFVDNDMEITRVIEHSDVCLSVNQAIPCALVLNELISNAFKHAFKGRKKGRVEISLMIKNHNKIVLKVKDNGIGIPEGIDILKTDSLGLMLMRNTVQDQLMGKIHHERAAGTVIIVEFNMGEEEVNFV